MSTKFLPALFAPLLLAGCATPFVSTNLTPQHQTRTTNNLYRVEVAVASNQQSLRWQSIRPQIMVGNEFYKMTPTLLMSNRWEGLIPIPSNSNVVKYRYKFDFQYNAFGAPGHDSSLSSEYTLRVLEPQP